MTSANDWKLIVTEMQTKEQSFACIGWTDLKNSKVVMGSPLLEIFSFFISIFLVLEKGVGAKRHML